MSSGEIKTIIFDLDGTLIDTEPAASAAITQCFQGWGIEVEPQDAAFITGKTWATAFEFLFKKYKIPVTADKASKQMMSCYRAALKEELIEVKGSVEAVKNLAQHYPLGLVSGSHRSEILFALDKLGITKSFQVILGCEDYFRSKPAPDGYLRALALMEAKPQATVVFEDSEAGIDSAIAAGIWVVAINSTNHFDQDTGKAHASVHDLQGVNSEWIKAASKKFFLA